MRNESGLTTTETLVALVLCAVLFVAGLGIGGAFDSESSAPPAEPPTTASTPPSGTSGSAGEPTPADLAALSLATASAKERAAAKQQAAARKGAVAGAGAAAAVLAQKAKAREEAAQRAAYWASVGATINSLHGLGAGLEKMRTAQQVKQRQTLLRALQARALFALGRLRQMQVNAQRRKLATLLVTGAGRAIDQSISQAERALGAATAQAANQAARELSRAGTGLNRTLTKMEGLYSRAVQAAANGNEAKAEALLAQLERVATQL
jgi:hypothetical protein